MTPTHQLKPSPAENGAVSLNDRVRALRLSQQPTARPRSAILPWALCAILLLTTTAFGYRAYRIGALDPSAALPATGEIKSETTTPTPSPSSAASSGEVVLQAKGYVVPAHQVQVSPKVGGMIIKLHKRFEEGQFIDKGDVLAELEDVDYRADLDRAVAAEKAAEQRWLELEHGNRPQEVKQALNELRESEATLKQLDRDLNRSERLAGTPALSPKEYEMARFARDSMKGRVERLRFAYDLMKEGARKERREAALNDWNVAKADQKRAQWRWENCKVLAPISGHILTKKAELGNLVNPLAFTISGSLCEMANLAELEIDLSVQERDIARVEKGQPCAIVPEAFQNHQPFRERHPRGYDGHVIRLMPIADRSKGAINVRVKVENIPKDEIGKILKPEMSVLVSFLKPGE